MRQRRDDREREANVRLLSLINRAGSTVELVRNALAYFRDQSRFQAVGIRLETMGDFPFYESVGLDAVVRPDKNVIVHPGSASGLDRTPGYACLCGLVLAARADPGKPFFTPGGSFWTNSLSGFLSCTTEDERGVRTRTGCLQAGYESLALVPLRSGGKILGLIHFGDKRKNRLTLRRMGLLEQLAGHLAVALAKTRAEEAHQQAEAAGRKNDERLRSLFEQAADAIVLFDPQTLGFVDFNEEACRMAGYTPAEYGGLRVSDLEVNETAEDIRRHGRTIIEKGLGVFETRHRTKAGDVLDVEVRTNAIRVDGQVLIQAVWRDITARKREERSLALAHEKARELEAIVSRNPSMAFRWAATPEFPVVFVSSNVAQLGYTAEDFTSGRVCWVEITHPGDVPRLNAELEQHAREGRDDFPMEYRIYDHGGRLRTMADNTHAVRDAGGRIVFYESVISDISDRKAAEEELRRTASELARSNRDLEQFAYVASHDLQEPLRQVRAFADLLQERVTGSADEKTASYFDFIREGASRMSDLVQGLLDYSRVGAPGTRFGPVSCQAALETALANLHAAFDESGARLTQDVLPVVSGESVQLTQLFQNLIGNAIKFRRECDPPLIHIGCRREPLGWLFEIRDNGIGIDPEYHEKIFVIFQRLHVRERYSGTGIGLAICKKIVERHGGRIWVQAEPGKGSSFFFTLVDNGTE